MLDGIHQTLRDEGMLRTGDVDRYHALRTYLKRRLKLLPVELEQNREGPDPGNGWGCELPMVDCGGWCAYPEECFVCDPNPYPEPEPRPAQQAAKVADVAIVGVPPPGGEPEPPPIDGCLPLIEQY